MISLAPDVAGGGVAKVAGLGVVEIYVAPFISCGDTGSRIFKRGVSTSV